MKTTGLIVACILVAALVANFAVPAVNSHSEQDKCIFGEVSNATYRSYLTLAKQRLTFRPALLFNEDNLAQDIENTFIDLSKGKESLYEKLAIMHATLRALGAEYRNTNANRPRHGHSDPYVDAVTDSATVSFNYSLDINGMWVLSPVQRQAWVIASLAGPLYERPLGSHYPKEVGGFGFIVHAPDPKIWPADYDLPRSGICPPVPSPRLAERFLSHP